MRRNLTEPIQIQTKDGRVIAEYLPNGKVKVFKGSFFRNVEVNSIRQNVKNERMYLLNNGYIINHQLTKDYIFDNPSIAISTLLGRMETGNQAFVTMDNIELGSYLEIDRIEAYEQHTRLSELFDKLNQDRLGSSHTIKLVDEDDDDGYVSTNDIDEAISVKASYMPLDKPEKIIGDRVSFKRNPEKAKKSIVLANYKCDLDQSHVSFISKNGKPYMEAHHLVPLSTQDYFDNSLDVDANIVCLCPNCHRKLHYGGNIKDELRKLFNDRDTHLKQSGIDISFEELVELYL
jgi:5-methylcytosine-specific restriction endonuclease McrA